MLDLIRGKVACSGLEGCVLVAVLNGGKEPDFVFANRAADGTTILLPIERGSREATVECCRQRLQIAIAQEKEDIAVEAVGSSLGDDVDDAVSRATNLGGESCSGNLKLLDGVGREVGERAANYLVVVVAAIDSNVAASSKAACRADLQGVRFCWIEGRCGTIAWYEIGELEEVSSVQRNALDGLRIDLALDHRLG